MQKSLRFSRLFLRLAPLAMLLFTACAGTRTANTPRLDLDLYHTVVFRYKGVETGKLTEKPLVTDFIARLNAGVADSTPAAVRSPCRISLLGREGTQSMRAQGKRFSLSGAGCRFGQEHCRYKAGFDVEAVCKSGGK